MIKRKEIPQIEFSKLFNNQLDRAPYEIKISFYDTLALFLDNPNDAHLRNHVLRGKYAGYRSFNVTEDWRAIFIQKIDQNGNKTVVFKFIGTHNQLYKR